MSASRIELGGRKPQAEAEVQKCRGDALRGGEISTEPHPSAKIGFKSFVGGLVWLVLSWTFLGSFLVLSFLFCFFFGVFVVGAGGCEKLQSTQRLGEGARSIH